MTHTPTTLALRAEGLTRPGLTDSLKFSKTRPGGKQETRVVTGLNSPEVTIISYHLS